MPATGKVKIHGQNFFVKFWKRLGEIDDPGAEEALKGLPDEVRRILDEASNEVKLEPTPINATAGGASSKKNIKEKEESKQHQEQVVHKEEKNDREEKVR